MYLEFTGIKSGNPYTKDLAQEKIIFLIFLCSLTKFTFELFIVLIISLVILRYFTFHTVLLTAFLLICFFFKFIYSYNCHVSFFPFLFEFFVFFLHFLLRCGEKKYLYFFAKGASS